MISPNMNLTIPSVGLTSGPQYATDINTSLSLIDTHDHSLGAGVQITPSGLNINSDLSLNINSLTSIKALTFSVQSTDSPAGSLYEKGVDLYFRDGNGNIIQMTQSGGINASSSGISSGTASAAFAGGVLVVLGASLTAAPIDSAYHILRNTTPSSFGLTLQPPNAMGADYTITLPALPLQTNVMTLDTSGNMGSITYDAVGQAMTSTGANAIAVSRTRSTGTSVGTGGIAISSSSGNYTTTSSSFVDITNLSVTITTSGRPVRLALLGVPGQLCSVAVADGSSGQAFGAVKFVRDSTDLDSLNIAEQSDGAFSDFAFPPGFIQSLDAVAAGTYTYKLQGRRSGSSTLRVTQCRLIAYEL